MALILSCGPLYGEPSGLDGRGHLATVVANGGDNTFRSIRLEHGVQFCISGVTKNVIFYGPETVRVNANAGQNHWTQPSIVVDAKPADISFEVEEDADRLTIISAKLRVGIDKKTGALTFVDGKGETFVSEKTDAPQRVTPRTIAGAPTYEVENTFTLKPDEAIYGFGFVDAAKTNRRGRELLLVQTNIGIVIPMMVSSERYGIMWDTYSKMTFKDDANGARLWAESAPGGVDYYFFAGESLDDVISGYRTLTGAAPMYPKQAFGLFMSKERYTTQQRLLEVARTFRQEQFPLDYIVQDWQYWGSDKDGTWSGMIWNKERFPDPEGMTHAIHDLDMKLMISIWPSVGNDTELSRELDAHHLRFEPLHWISKKARIYDAFSEQGRQIYFKHVKSGLLDKGVDALWMDGTEVEVGGACHNAAEVERDIKNLGVNAMGDFTRYLNPYTLMTTKGTYEGQRATSNRRVLTLTRSAWAGAQRYAATSWSGDTSSSWQTLKEQVSGGVNVTMAGNPYWTQDCGGFFINGYPRGERNPAYRELFARWFQYSAFNPLMRVHGTNIEREPYIFKELDPPMYDSLVKAVNLRYRLLPYIYGLSWRVTSDGYTMMRGLAMDFPDDRRVDSIDDEFMFGPSILVQPVTRTMYHAAQPLPPLVPADVLSTPDGKAGLAVQYFEGMNFEKPAGTAVDAKVDYTWPGPPLAGPPAGLTQFDRFSARWEGVLAAPEDGEYEIGLEGDDGYRLFLDGKKVVEDWAARDKTYGSTKITLTRGQKLPIKIEYFNHSAARVLRLLWRTPTDLKAFKPQSGPDLSMQTYLPQTPAGWYDFWTNERHDGGQTVTTQNPLDCFPLFVRAGSILPLGPTQQYATEKPDAPYEIRVYPGANATFTIYEDDNETYDYEKGHRATYELAWDDATKTLTVGARQGTFPGMIAVRQLNVVLATPGKNAGHTTEPAEARSITYDGTPASVRF